MARDPEQPDYASIKLTHRATIGERAETLRRRPGRRSSKPECLVIGHAWTEEPHREGASICIVCQIVRFP
jgi:hypothetical protein